MRLAALALLGALQGCAVLQSRELFVACRAADVATTIRALQLGATESNGIQAGLMSHGYLPFIAFQAAFAYLIWREWDRLEDGSGAGKTLVNALNCIPAANNYHVIRTQRTP